MSRFLGPYMQYVAQHTDAPVEFGHASGLMCLSGITLGRRWLMNGLHPNLFMLLVGPSSRDRKSKSIGLGIDILEDVEPDRIGPSDFTVEGLVGHMRTQKDGNQDASRMVIPIPEFGMYLAQGKKSYMSGGGPLLCQLYDGDTVKRMRAKDTIIVKHPRVSLIGGCAHGMLEQYVDKVDWEGGFFARMLFIVGKTKTHEYTTLPSKNDVARDAVRAALRDLCNDLTTYTGAHPIDPVAQQTYDYYVRSIPDRSGDPATVAQRERLLNTIPKLALLYQLDLNPSMPIGIDAMNAAIGFSQHAWASFTYAYGLSAGSGQTKLMKKVWRKLWTAPDHTLRRRELLRGFTMTIGELFPVLDNMKKLGIISELSVDGSMVYKTTMPYVDHDDADGLFDSDALPPGSSNSH
jgi:hypothetical protein